MQVIEKEEFHVIGIGVVSDWEGLHIIMPLKWKIFKKCVHEVDDRMMDISPEYNGKRYKQ